MRTSILICSPRYGGCSHVEESTQWDGDGGDYLLCPVCGEDHAFQLTNKNFDALTEGLSEKLRIEARGMLDGYYAVECLGLT